MEKILSQEEINALFASMASGSELLEQQSAAQTAVFTHVTKYDFCRSDRLPKDQMRSIHLIHSYFARSFSSSLSAYLRTMAEVSLQSIEQMSYLSFLKRVSDPTLYCSLTLRPMDGSVAMEIAPAIAFPMIDTLLGGAGHSPADHRALTEIETNIMGGVIRLVLRDLKEAWRPIMELDPRLEGLETKPQMLQIVAPGEAVVAVSLEIKLAGQAGMLSLCLPSVMLKVNRAKFDQHWRPRRPDSEGREAQKIRELLRTTSLTLSAEIHDRSLLIDDLLSLSVGDIIQLDRCLGDPVLLCIGGIAKFQGRVVLRRGKKAFEIVEPYES